MSHECHHGSCSNHSHSKSHSHSSCCACSDEVNCGCGCHEGHKYSEELLAVADEAWMELMKDKIKEEIKKHSGEHIEQIARLVAQANHARWNHKIGEKENLHSYEEELHNLIFRQK